MNSRSGLTPEALELRLRTMLPDLYQDAGRPVRPASMGSASLAFGLDGRVAWDRMWASFCDLAMAGGPPHRGRLLQPGSPAAIISEPGRYRQVVDEISRGIELVTGFDAEPSRRPGWVRVDCPERSMAGWLVRAIAMENVSARLEAGALELPAGPAYRVDKEIKNVITVIAKTCHYWRDHMNPARRQTIAALLDEMDTEYPLLQPALDLTLEPGHTKALTQRVVKAIGADTLVTIAPDVYPGWLGITVPADPLGTAPSGLLEEERVSRVIRTVRTLVLSNALARGEGTTVFVPVNPVDDPQGERLEQLVWQAASL